MTREAIVNFNPEEATQYLDEVVTELESSPTSG